MKKHLEKAIAYVKANHGFTDDEIAHELKAMDWDRRPVCDNYLNKVRDLMDDYTKDNGLEEDWWREFKDEEDIFWDTID